PLFGLCPRCGIRIHHETWKAAVTYCGMQVVMQARELRVAVKKTVNCQHQFTRTLRLHAVSIQIAAKQAVEIGVNIAFGAANGFKIAQNHQHWRAQSEQPRFEAGQAGAEQLNGGRFVAMDTYRYDTSP